MATREYKKRHVIPLGDSVPRRQQPVVTQALIVACVLVFLYEARTVLGPFIIAGIIAYIFTGAVTAVQERLRWPRALVAALPAADPRAAAGAIALEAFAQETVLLPREPAGTVFNAWLRAGCPRHRNSSALFGSISSPLLNVSIASRYCRAPDCATPRST